MCIIKSLASLHFSFDITMVHEHHLNIREYDLTYLADDSAEFFFFSMNFGSISKTRSKIWSFVRIIWERISKNMCKWSILNGHRPMNVRDVYVSCEIQNTVDRWFVTKRPKLMKRLVFIHNIHIRFIIKTLKRSRNVRTNTRRITSIT